MLWHDNESGKNTWTDVNQCDSVSISAGQNAMEINVIAQKGAKTTSSIKDQLTQRQFKIHYKLVLLPEADWFLSEIVSVQPSDNLPLAIKGIFFRLYPAFQVIPLPADMVPNLWNDNQKCAWRSRMTSDSSVLLPAKTLILRFTIGPAAVRRSIPMHSGESRQAFPPGNPTSRRHHSTS